MKKILSFSIATQLTLSLIGAVALSVLITGGALSYLSFRAQLSQLQLTQQARAQVVSEKINAYVDDLQQKLSYLARVPGLTTFAAATQRNLLEGLIQHNNAYEWVGLTDRQGHLLQVLSPFGESVPQEWATTAVFRRAFQEQEDFIGPVEREAQSWWPALILAVPVRNQQNEVDGMLFARINLKFLWAVLDETVKPESGYVYLVDRRQFVIAQSGQPPAQAAFEDLSQSQLGEIIASGPTAAPQTYRGLRQVAVLGNIATVPSLNWHVVVELPLSEAYAPLYNLLGLMGVVLTLGIIIAALLSVLLARQLTQPLHRLTLAATRLSRGELETRVVISQENELKILADAFNHMAAQLHDTIYDLQQDIIARKQAEETLSAKTKELESYLYVASHDLRSPLVNIQGFSQRLQKQTDALTKILAAYPFDSETRQSFEKITDEGIPKTLAFILTNVSKMDALINGLLQLSRTGRVKMTLAQVEMNALLENVIHTFNFQLEAAGAVVTVENLPACYGDANLLNQLFSNLISNALNYRAKNRPLIITIAAKTEYNKAVYSIKDTGQGIAPKHLEKIWDVFYRVESSAAEAGEGIGLSIVKTIVDKHQGKIWVESEVGRGTVFYVELPQAEFSE